MGYFRNPEIRREAVIFAVLSLAAAGLGFWLFGGLGCGILAGLSAIFCAVHFLSSYLRYRNICRLSAQLNALLHHQDCLQLAQYREGELSVLRTEVEKLLQRLQYTTDQLQKDKALLSDSMADISHQLRTPLTSINLITAMLVPEDLSQQRKMELLQELKHLLSRIDWLVEALLKLSRIDAGAVNFRREPVSVKALVETACAPLSVPMEVRGQSLRLVVDDEQFLGDAAWSAEALGNILKNCMEHTPEGGQITVSASQTALYTELCVADTGSGIPPEDLPHLFERFYKGKNATADSFGIGLALAQRIVSAQNGTLRAENRPQGGAAFFLRFYHTTV